VTIKPSRLLSQDLRDAAEQCGSLLVRAARGYETVALLLQDAAAKIDALQSALERKDARSLEQIRKIAALEQQLSDATKRAETMERRASSDRFQAVQG
jgi:hypothetical protein